MWEAGILYTRQKVMETRKPQALHGLGGKDSQDREGV
jgi:hypothetical protein